MTSNRMIVKKEARKVRIWRVLRMKMTGATDRDIQRQLEEDPENPVKITHVQVNRDWHDAISHLVEKNRGQAESLRMLMAMRLERLLLGQWEAATARIPNARAVEICLKIIQDQRELFGLDRELGSEERPITVDQGVTIDLRGLSDEELDHLIALAERQAITTGEGS